MCLLSLWTNVTWPISSPSLFLYLFLPLLSLPSAILLSTLLFGKIILPLHSLLEKRASKGAQRGRGSEGNWLLLLFKSEACCLLGDNWHTRRVMCLDRKEESKKKRKKKRVGKLKGTLNLKHLKLNLNQWKQHILKSVFHLFFCPGALFSFTCFFL